MEFKNQRIYHRLGIRDLKTGTVRDEIFVRMTNADIIRDTAGSFLSWNTGIDYSLFSVLCSLFSVLCSLFSVF